MRILYSGSFLKEGLVKVGHTVFPFGMDKNVSVSQVISLKSYDPDIVLLEIWGTTQLPKDLHLCNHRIVAYCIDSCINEFFLKRLMLLFDDVFVDQISSVDVLRKNGIRAKWLPLCVSEGMFRGDQEKKHDVVFVGRLTEYRRKRLKLLSYLKDHCSLSRFENVSVAEMQDIFSESRIVLNENLFSGLTYRVLQGLASGSLVLTEDGGAGVGQHFKHGQHLACYTHDSVVNQIRKIKADPDYWEQVARQGQRLCRERHTSAARAAELITHLERRSAFNTRRDADQRQLAEAQAKYAQCQRFGGDYGDALKLAVPVAARSNATGVKSSEFIGTVYARNGKIDQAKRYLLRCIERQGGLFGAITLALMFLHHNDLESARRGFGIASRLTPIKYVDAKRALLAISESTGNCSEVYLVLAKLYYDMGIVFDPGFLKQYQEIYPEYALEFAKLAWAEEKTRDCLEMFMLCAKKMNLEHEVFDYLKESIAFGLADDHVIAYASEIAMRNYDFSQAKMIAEALRRSLR
ncbi:hypothetical protein C6366_00010 [Desulfonatronum sp. SC1]|nr:hypothetical protein C6366_00010 [Desulfonatronum sp. SC1]